MMSFQEPAKEFSEPNERAIQPYQPGHSTQPVEMLVEEGGEEQNQTHLNTLLGKGFDWAEAKKLLNLRETLHENTEMRQRLAEDNYMQFARWLYEQGEMNDQCDD